MYQYEYPRPAVSVDVAILADPENEKLVLLIQRLRDPFATLWALPGGFVEMDETLEQSAARELREETGLADIPLTQLGAYSAVDRDPRGRVISVAFLARIDGPVPVQAGDDAGAARWFRVDDLPELAFDHAAILQDAVDTVSR